MSVAPKKSLGQHFLVDRNILDVIGRLAELDRADVVLEIGPGLGVLTRYLAERVAHPRYEVPRVYHAKVHGIPDQAALERVRRGVRVDGEQLRADSVRVLEREKNAWLEITLHEGKNHEVKRLFEAVGHPVSKLKRVAIGPLTTRGLKPGAFRALTPQEVRRIAPRRARP